MKLNWQWQWVNWKIRIFMRSVGELSCGWGKSQFISMSLHSSLIHLSACKARLHTFNSVLVSLGIVDKSAHEWLEISIILHFSYFYLNSHSQVDETSRKIHKIIQIYRHECDCCAGIDLTFAVSAKFHVPIFKFTSTQVINAQGKACCAVTFHCCSSISQEISLRWVKSK